MEELKLLISMVADLPSLAIWVLVAFYAYKVAIIGSIYGVIRFTVEKLHSWLTTPKTDLVAIDATLQGMTITGDGSHNALVAQIERVRGKALSIDSRYIHRCSVEWLRRAIDAQEQKDLEAKKEKTA